VTGAQEKLLLAVGALSREPLALVAERTGKSIAALALSRCRDVLDARPAPGASGVVSSGVWRQLSPDLRAVLLTLCTERSDPHRDALQGWAAFGPDERVRIGAMARQFARDLKGAAWLR